MPIWDLIRRGFFILCGAAALAVAFPEPAPAQSGAQLPLPPGEIIVGPVFRRNGTSVPSITTGFDANAYIFSVPPTQSFVNSAQAVVVRTTVPTQYVRFYTAGVTNPVGGFIAGSNAVRGLTPAQIRDVLALPYQPDSMTIVKVPAGTCILVGPAAPILGNFPANPPAIPTPGPWGRGGPVQEDLIGVSANPGCANPQFLPGSDYINRQPIGAFALAYRPRGGGGNVGAVAAALDDATPPPLFTDMDSVYNALDILNFGNPAPLRAALAQLDGEIYADVPSVTIAAGQMFLDVLRDQTHLARSFTGPLANGILRPWVSGFGGGGTLFGNGDTHRIGFGGGGIAAGVDYRFSPALQAGVAAAYARSAFGTSGISGSGGLDSFTIGSYAGYAAGQWYIDGAVGYSYNSATVNRSISFLGIMPRAPFSYPVAHAFLSRAETGYRFPLDDRAAATPFASFQGIVVGQGSFAEAGAGAVGLSVHTHTAARALSTLGAELSYDLPLGLAVPLGLSARAGWAHDFASVTRNVTANFEGTPDASFTVNGARWPRNAAAVGVRCSLPLQPANLFIRYDGTLASGASIHSATAGVLIVF